MQVFVYLPLLFGAFFGVAAPVLARRLPPAAATWLLSVGGLITAGAAGTALALLAVTLIGQAPVVAAVGRWSDAALRRYDPVPPPVAAVAALVLVVLVGRFLTMAVRRGRALREAHALAAALPTRGVELAVIDDRDYQALAVPGRPGRVVVSTGLLRGVDGAGRRVVIAHERAHLRHHHHLHHTAAHLAAAANPLLSRIPAAVALATERWADEEAAHTSRRDTVARVLVLVGGRGGEPAAAPTALAVAATDVAARVAALLAPAPRLTGWPVFLFSLLLATPVVAVLAAAGDTERLFELAQQAFRALGR